ncbi:SNF2-related protein [Occallatibacter savannae]|uniref:SNF2-related protein n=1 Tax=Occallatibacter savannae TaxID=1002691 RepID=UPI000D69AF45|nr:SNF2-related protein [Occallatibacter savannae]
MNWTLFEGSNITVTAEERGVLITRHEAPQSSISRFERILPTVLLQLEDMELTVAQSESSWLVAYPEFARLEENGINAFENLCRWSPLSLELESSRWLGATDFRYAYRFYWGSKLVSSQRLGCFLKAGNETFRLDSDTFNLLEAIDTFNGSSVKEKTVGALLRFHEIKGLAGSIGAKLDKYLAAERVLLPSKLGVDIIAEGGGRISFVPKVEGVPQDALTRAFFAEDDIESVYAVDDAAGGRVRVIFDEEQQEVLRRIQRVRHLGGQAKAEIMRDPSSVFDGVSGSVEFAFGPRVIGIGDFPFTVRPYLDSRTGILDEQLVEPEPELGLECTYADGSSERIRFTSRQELLQLKNDVSDAIGRGAGTVEFNGKTISITADFEKSLAELLKPRGKKVPPTEEPQRPGKYVLIYTNENSLEYQGESPRVDPRFRPELPLSFSAVPKAHQFLGYQWLRANYESSRGGCLLADDMGLGKTLQVLLFLAALIETGDLSDVRNETNLPPWNPILIIAPVILVENATWQTDMRTFFKDEGSIFEPLLVLHGDTIKSYRNPEMRGREIAIGQPALRLEELRRFKVILTNYETVVNYQHSFAKVRWSAVVTDEAQEFKTPSTKVSHALKALNSRFRIASTGTPVETRLFDVWNLFDYLQPGPLLGSATEFRKDYESASENAEGLPKLKERLRLGHPDAFLLRRNKADVLDLPPKIEHYIKSVLSKRQVDWHTDLLNRKSENSSESHPFSILHHLMRLYQHPSLVPKFEPPTAEEAMHSCPKLQSVVDCLRGIRSQSEKALIFTRSIDMQQLLAVVLEHVFGFQVHIVNGATGKDGRKGIGKSRRGIVDAFRNSSGFNVLILSPDVAGIGLTIVEANHVIHYGRWWNPAKESQATDRAYRIGQTKPVHVYYPISTHPENSFPTFDEKLDELLRLRKQLAADFLSPIPSENDLQRELLDSLGVTDAAVPPQQVVTVDDITGLTWDRFEALVALIENKSGRKAWLSPRCGDGGVDVISQLGSEVRLIQCKHTQWTDVIDRDVLYELMASCDNFRANLRVAGFTFKPMLVTNASVSRQTKEFGISRDIEIVAADSFSKFMGNSNYTRAEIESVEFNRYSSLPRLKADLIGQLSQMSSQR